MKKQNKQDWILEKEDEYEPIRDNPNSPQNYPREFNLSEKRQDRKHPNPKKPFNDEFTYPEEDVKEFIKRQIDRIKSQSLIVGDWLIQEMQEDAGEKLI